VKKELETASNYGFALEVWRRRRKSERSEGEADYMKKIPVGRLVRHAKPIQALTGDDGFSRASERWSTDWKNPPIISPFATRFSKPFSFVQSLSELVTCVSTCRIDSIFARHTPHNEKTVHLPLQETENYPYLCCF